MKRLTLTMVSRGASAASLRAARPTIGALSPVYATTLGSSVEPSSTGSALGLPAPVSGSGRTTATSEFVVPRSMPTAAVAQASLARASPGSAIWNSAISDLRRAPLDLVEVARVVPQPRQQLRGPLQLGVRGALLAQGARDLLHRLLPLLAVLKRLLEELLRHRRAAAPFLARDLHAAQREQVLRAPHRIPQRAVRIVQQGRLLQREAALAGRGPGEAVRVQLARERAERLLQRALVHLVRAQQAQHGELVQHALRRRRRLDLPAGRAKRVRGSAGDPAAPADRMALGHETYSQRSTPPTVICWGVEGGASSPLVEAP